MSAFPNWQQYIVTQKRSATGCIPTGYEVILRAANCEGVNFETFQDEFDLDKDLNSGEQPQNNFESVAQAIQAKYPDVRFKHVGFPKGEGQKKLVLVEELIRQRLPVLVSLSRALLSPPYGGGGWHIMPVVDASNDSLTLLWSVDENSAPHTITLRKSDFVAIHEKCRGGDDIAFLERPHADAAGTNRL
jgi:hypothetical protein